MLKKIPEQYMGAISRALVIRAIYQLFQYVYSRGAETYFVKYLGGNTPFPIIYEERR